eukprot:820592_1
MCLFNSAERHCVLNEKVAFGDVQVSLLCLSELCKGNIMAQEWIRVNCFGELEQLASWVQRNKNYRQNKRGNKRSNQYQNNNNCTFYRWEPAFNDKNKKGQQLKNWRSQVTNKLRGMQNLTNPKENLQTAMNYIF